MKRFIVSILLLSLFFISQLKGYSQTTYTWSAPSGVTNDWTFSSNWTPNRTIPAANDIIVFDGSICANPLVNFIPNQTIGKLRIFNNAHVELNVTANDTLTIGNVGIAAPHFSVETGSKLTVPTLTFALSMNIVTGCTGLVSDSIVFSGDAHRLTAADASSLEFATGSAFRAGPGFTGSAFGTANSKAVIFQRGSVYISQAGANPFGATAPGSAVVFQPGSLFSYRQNLSPSLSGRTYANFEIDLPSFNQLNMTGANPFRCDTFTVKNATAATFTLNGGMIVSGDFKILSGTVAFSPTVSNTLLFDGIVRQTVSGTFTLNNPTQVVVAPNAFVDLQTNLSSPDSIIVFGKLYANSFTVSGNSFFMHPYGGGSAPAGDVANGSNKIINCTNAAYFVPGMPISGTGIPANTYVTNSYGTTLEISRFATATASGTTLATTTNIKATLGIGSPNGITIAPTASGNIQTTSRSFLADATYEYNSGVGITQVTGTGLPSTITGKLKINTLAGLGTTGVTLTQPITVTGEFILTKGKLTTAMPNILYIGASAVTTAAYTDNSFVNGTMSKYGNTPYKFPVGKGVDIHPAQLETTNGDISDLYTVEYFKANPASFCTPGTFQAGIDHISKLEYWAVQCVSVFTPVNQITLYATGYTYATARDRLVITDCTSGSWINLGNADISGMGAVGPVTSLLTVNGGFLNFFTFASLDPIPVNPLPITLISFDASKLSHTKSSVNWELAACCSASVKFEIQRAGADKGFITIGTAGGNETNKLYNYIDNGSKNGVNYYRLKMIDVDGKITYSRTVAVMNGVNGLLLTSLIPSVITNTSTLTVASSGQQQLGIIIVDMQGRVVLKRNYTIAAGNTNIGLSLAGLAAGVYQLTGISVEGRTNKFRFIKQ
jgi:hypothetical protein